MLVGIVSDTHGTLPAWVLDAFDGIDRIIHAGDIGCMEVLYDLQAAAPVDAVLGNCDHSLSLVGIPTVISPLIGGVRFQVVHKPVDLRRSAGTRVYVHGHTHVPSAVEDSGALVICPGSPCEPRGGSAPSVAVVEVEDGSVIGWEFRSDR